MNKETKKNITFFLCIILAFIIFKNINKIVEGLPSNNIGTMATFQEQQQGISEFEQEQVDPSGFGALATEIGSLWNHYVVEPAEKWDSNQDHYKRDIDTHRYATGGDTGH
tara:strand:- start:248 stop:577 length:330 start_codon:yes stop_codon:yes gene_type:complete